MATITTIHGDMDEATPGLEKREGGFENENEKATWVEYWLNGELVHRSVHVRLKRGLTAEAIAGSF